MEKLHQRLASKLKTLRLEKGFTQENMAEMLGFKSTSSYAEIENGTKDITLSKVDDIAKILNMTPVQLLQVAEIASFSFYFQQGTGFGNNQSTINVHEKRLEEIEKTLAELQKK
jgi:transcriptional regulator with XRE-family HTH domain